MNNKQSKGIFWGLMIGGFAGLMLAKQSGHDLRQSIKNGFFQKKQQFQQLKSQGQSLNQAITTLTHEGVESVNQALNEIKLQVENFQAENQPRINRIQEGIIQLKSHLINEE